MPPFQVASLVPILLGERVHDYPGTDLPAFCINNTLTFEFEFDISVQQQTISEEASCRRARGYQG